MLWLTGGGGSILAVPLFVYIFSFTPLEATSYSLWLVGITSFFALFSKFRAGLVDIKTGLLFGIPSLIGVSGVRHYLIPLIPETFDRGQISFSQWTLIMIVFAIIMIFAAWSMIRKRNSPKQTTDIGHSPFLKYILIMGEGVVVWGITGFVWAGGWFLIIPALVFLTKLPIKQAIGTSLLIITIKSLLWFVWDVSYIDIDRMFFTIISVISTIGMLLGHYIQRFINEQHLKKGFGYFILVMWWFIIIKEFFL